MTNNQFWEQITYFRPEEFGIVGHMLELQAQEARDNMNPQLILKLDSLREFVGRSLIIHAGFEVSGHSPGSQHYLGNAADFHIEGLSLLEQYLAAERFNFSAIGLYPFWERPGLHCDVRPLGLRQPGPRWFRDGQGTYLALTARLLEELKIR